MGRRSSVFIVLVICFLGFLYLDLRVRYHREQRRRVKLTSRLQKLTRTQHTQTLKDRENTWVIRRLRRRLYATGGNGELIDFFEPLDPDLVRLAGEVREELKAHREAKAPSERRLPEQELNESGKLLLEGDRSPESFRDFFRKVMLWGELALGFQWLEKLEAEYPEDRVVSYHLAQAYLIRAAWAVTEPSRIRDLRSALVALDRILEEEPDHHRARLLRGYYRTTFSTPLGLAPKGAADLRRLLERGEECPGALRGEAGLYLGSFYLSLGLTEKAREAFSLGGEADPDNRALAEWTGFFSGEE